MGRDFILFFLVSLLFWNVLGAQTFVSKGVELDRVYARWQL